MDRDNRWERVELHIMLWYLEKVKQLSSAVEAIEKSYHDNKSDEFVLPCVINENGATNNIRMEIQ